MVSDSYVFILFIFNRAINVLRRTKNLLEIEENMSRLGTDFDQR